MSEEKRLEDAADNHAWGGPHQNLHRKVLLARDSFKAGALWQKEQERKAVCSYCNGLGYDPYPNHDTTMRPCPECEDRKYIINEQALLLNATADRAGDLQYELTKANHTILSLTEELSRANARIEELTSKNLELVRKYDDLYEKANRG